MSATRRAAAESRVLLIQAAAQIINDEGYAALSARALAEKVGLKRQIVHYYFRTMEDLLLAVVRHYGNESVDRLSQATSTGNPLRAIWDEDPDASATTYAFLAMGKHLPAIQVEVETYFRRLRDIKIHAVAAYLAKTAGQTNLPAASLVTIVQSIAQGLKAENSLGSCAGHDETRAMMERCLDKPEILGACFGSAS